MQVHFDNFALKLNLYILNYVYGNNFHSKINKNCKNKQFNGCAFENFHIHMIHKYIVYIYVKKNVHKYQHLIDFKNFKLQLF